MTSKRVTPIDVSKQEFNGTVYYLCGHYFQNKGNRLHRAVWEFYNGAIPRGCHIHHIDGDRTNNNIENLACVQASEHISEHAHSQERQEYGKMHIERIRPKASEWHKSEAGRAWHSEQCKRNMERRKVNTYYCTQCGKSFQTKHIYGPGTNRFCGNNCRAKYGRAHRKTG